MSRENFDNFRMRVFHERSLQERLRAVTDRTAFFAAVVREGAAAGFDFTTDDVETAFSENQRAWFERWI